MASYDGNNNTISYTSGFNSENVPDNNVITRICGHSVCNSSRLYRSNQPAYVLQLNNPPSGTNLVVLRN